MLYEVITQRVAVKYHLHSLAVDTTESYIKHRLQVAGARRMLFTGDTIPAIHRFAGGVPRLINTLCDNCLFETYLQKQPAVDSYNFV